MQRAWVTIEPGLLDRLSTDYRHHAFLLLAIKAGKCLITIAISSEGETLNRFHLFFVLIAHGKKCTQPRATALPWGFVFFF
jgi:hypothetical protein